MANYYLNDDGTLTNSKKKKKKGTNYVLQSDGTLKAEVTTPKTTVNTKKNDDIAPVKNKNSWFKSGAFSDGYDFGDITKTILGTNKDVSENLSAGVARIAEGAIDLVPMAIGGVANMTGNDDLANKMKNFQKRNLIEEYGIDKKISENLPGGQALKLGNAFLNKGDAESNSVFGSKSQNLIQSAAQMGGTIGLQMVGVPWWVTTGVTAFSGGAEEAFNNDATYGEAATYGVISAGAEVLTEKIGGIKFGGKALLDPVKKQLATAITKKSASTLARFGIDAAAEGGEEVLSEIIQNIGKKLTYEDEKTWKELLTSEDAMEGYLDAFIGGAVMGGGFSANRAYSSIKTGRDYDTGLTDNEQRVIDIEIKNRTTEKQKKAAVNARIDAVISEREKTFGTLTEAEKKNIRQQVQTQLDNGELDYSTAELDKKEIATIEKQVKEDLDRGYIGIDTIESTLAGEKTAQIKDLTAELSRTTNEEKKAEIQAKINQLTADRATQMQSMLKNDIYLQESYRQEALKKVEFDVQPTEKDSDITRELLESAKSVKMNNTRKMHEVFDFTNKIANDTKTRYGFTNNAQLKELGYEVEGASINGLVRVEKDGSSKVLINVDSQKALDTIIGHETTHLLEGTNEYKALQDIVKQYATTKGEYDNRLKSMQKLYEGTNANIENEITADLVGDYLFSDAQFVNELSANRNIFQRVYDFIKHAYKMATAGSQEARQLEQVKRKFDAAYRQMSKATTRETETNLTTEADSNTKFSITKDNDGNNVVVIDQNIYEGMIDSDKPHEYIAEFIAAEVGNSYRIIESGQSVYIGEDLPAEFTQSKYTQALKNRRKDLLNVKNQSAQNLKDIVEIATDRKWEKNTKQKHNIDAKYGFYKYTTRFAIDKGVNSPEYKATLVIRNDANGKKYLYDVMDIKKVGVLHLTSTSQGSHGYVGGKTPPQGTPTNSIVTESGADGNTKFSLSDSQGRKLSKGQQEYFKDSKVRDENGSLKVMYHGTPAGDYTVFKDGTYFTENKEYADRYQSPSASSISTGKEATAPKTFEVYLDIKKPFDISDPEAREIYINDYIKGGNAMGINPYLSDAEYNKIQSIDWTEGEDLRDFLIDEEYDYDGLILDEGADGGYGEAVQYRGKSYVVFSPNQIKNVNNENPTDDPDIRFSLSDSQGRELTKSQQEYFKDSKVRDENGSLKVMYHGTGEAGFHEFVPGFSDDGNSFFFTDNSSVAKSYSGTNETYAAETFRNAEDFNSFFRKISADDYEVREIDGNFVLYEDGDEIATSETADGIYEEFRDWSGIGYGSANYEVYLNLTNPLVVDAESNQWDEIPFNGETLTTREISALAKEDGYDGVIFNNIFDIGIYASGKERFYTSTVAIAFDSNQIKSVNNQNPTNDPDIRYSLSQIDSEYKSAVESGDIKTAQLLVDEAARAAGYTERLYHQTGATFTEFNTENQKAGKYDSEMPTGFFLKPTDKDIGLNGKKQIGVYANLKNPLRFANRDAAKYHWMKNVPEWETANAEIELIDKEYSSKLEVAEKAQMDYISDWRANNSEASRAAIYDDAHFNKMLNEEQRIIDEWGEKSNEARLKAKKAIDNYIESSDYDGIILEQDKGSFGRLVKSYIVFEPAQIKSADAVTYDKYLNVIPLSERFKSDNPDIRYSLSRSGISPYDYGRIYGKDVKLQRDEIAPAAQTETAAQEDIAPVVIPEDQIYKGGRSLTEADLPYVDQERDDAFMNIPDYYEPAEAEETYSIPDTAPIDNKSLKLLSKNMKSELGLKNKQVASLEKIIQDFSTSENDSKDSLYEKIESEFGTIYENSKIDEVVQIKRDLRSLKVKVSDTIKGDIPDYFQFKQKNFGKIRFSNEGLAVDDVYEGLKTVYPEYFPDDIINPTDQLLKMVEVANLDSVYTEEYFLPEEQIQDVTDFIYESVLDYKREMAMKASHESGMMPIDENAMPPDVDIAPIESDFKQEDSAPDKETQVDTDATEVKEEPDKVEEDLVTKTRKDLRKQLLGVKKESFIQALDDAKNIPMALMNNTDTIRNTELVFGRENAKVINREIFQKEIDNEAKSIAWQNKERESIKALGIKARSKESAAVQKYGEGKYVNEFGDEVEYNDDDLRSEFADEATREKIKHAASVIRSKYDSYIETANSVLTKLGFEPIKKRDDYMRHFQELSDVFSRYGIPFNAQAMQEHVLPTDINGLTEFWSPQKNYFASMQPRKGKRSTYDAITGIDGYISGVSNLIYHTEDIQRGRAFEELIRETYGEESGWDNLEKLEGLSPEEYQARADKIQNNHLSNYAAWVHEWTNNIAGKKHKVDRSAEALFGRKMFSFLDQTRKQVGSNMIGFNVSSSLTNLIASVQAMSKTNKLAVVKGTADTIKNIFIKDNFMEKNNFLTSRMGTDMLSKNAWQKIQDAGFVFMKGMDWFSSNQIVRSKYYELRSKGMSEEQAHAEAGKFAARIMGDRTKGAQAQLYNSKLIGLVTQFQLEVNNQLYSMFYDTYHESKENAKNSALRTAAGMTFTLGQLFGFTHLFGKTFEAIAGYNPTFDIIGILMTALGAGDDDEEKTTSERLKKAADQLVDALPYVNILTGGGRIPVASGIPNLIGVATGGKDQYGNEMTLEDEMKKLLYLIPPAGGNQIKKTTQGLGMFDDDLPVPGSYTDSGNLRFPVDDTPLNRIQAGLFGQWASENAGKYFDQERMPLKEKQIQEYKELDIPIADYWEYRDGLKKQKTLEDKFDYIAGLDLPVSKKNIMINNVVDRKEKVDLINYDDFESYEEFDFSVKNPDKYEFLQENHISYKSYNATEESREAYNWAFNNPEGYAIAKAVSGDVVQYRRYAEVIYDIKADKDENGKSISGSRKEKVANYINSLDADYGSKLILFKKEYPSEDSYNYEIIDYLNNRQDISYAEMQSILTKLGFQVDAGGNITW